MWPHFNRNRTPFSKSLVPIYHEKEINSMLVGKLHCRVWESENKKSFGKNGWSDPSGYSHLSPSMCHYFLYSSWHSAGHSWSNRQGRNQSTVSLLHSLFRSCLLSAPGLARNVLKIHPWNNKVWVPCKEREKSIKHDSWCERAQSVPAAADHNLRVGRCAIRHSHVLLLKCCTTADCLKPLRWDNSTTVAMVTRACRCLTAQHSLTASLLH